MEKVSNAAGAKLHDLKRRKDFDEMILPASPGRWLEPELSGRQEGGVAGHLNKLTRRGLISVLAWQFSPEMHPGPTILGPPPVGQHRT